ncbi:MAG TPA: HAMP domain-containing sensor histidine kinase [Actinoplanes sp.]|nr:HAMP domain-containing sensor histidine kinase [Actinoplanes sp.]
MRRRLILLVAATTSLVLVAFLVPLALLVRTTAADRALSAAAAELEALAPVVATVDRRTLTRTAARVNAEGGHPVTVFLPGGDVVGAPAARSNAVTVAAAGQSLNAAAPGGVEVLVAVAGLADGTAVIRTFVGDAELRRGVVQAWAVLVGLGIGLMLLSALVADRLARTLIGPLSAVADVSHRLAHGDLTARAVAAGPPEIRQVCSGLNHLATRIGGLLAAERELVADLSHRLRTPLTAIRVDAESLPGADDRHRLTRDVDLLERTVNAIIWEARQEARPDGRCDAVRVAADRVGFWAPLAEEEGRRIDVDLADGPVPVRVAPDDLAACLDALLGNVFAHTPEGCGMRVRLTRGPMGGALLSVADDGPGLPGPQVLERGRSGSGSTGLGLDIVRRVAARSGGAVTFGRGVEGGAVVTVELGPPDPDPAEPA